jgi:uncharacterized membrane protein
LSPFGGTKRGPVTTRQLFEEEEEIPGTVLLGPILTVVEAAVVDSFLALLLLLLL